MRLIDADELKKAMDGYWGRCQRIRKPRNGETAVFLDVMATVEKQPTIDAAPVKHGMWLPKHHYIAGYEFVSGHICSECGNDALNAEGDDFLTEFCPNCGARMKECDDVER